MTAYAGEDVEQGGTSPLLMEVKTCTGTMQINMVYPKKAESLSRSRFSYITLGFILKEYSILPQG